MPVFLLKQQRYNIILLDKDYMLRRNKQDKENQKGIFTIISSDDSDAFKWVRKR